MKYVLFLLLSAALVQSLKGIRPELPGTFTHCRHCRVEIDYTITYDFGPAGPDEFRWVVYRKWNGD